VDLRFIWNSSKDGGFIGLMALAKRIQFRLSGAVFDSTFCFNLSEVLRMSK
jgi:hypothetical protein